MICGLNKNVACNIPKFGVKSDHFHSSILAMPEVVQVADPAFDREVVRMCGWTTEELALLVTEFSVPGKYELIL